MSEINKSKINNAKIDKQNKLYIKYIIEKSRNLWDLHISESGEAFLNFFASFLKSFLPDRFEIITNSYIVASKGKIYEGFNVSPQVDLIVYDKIVGGMNLFYDPNNEVRLVPIESVLGVFELKRTLNESKLLEAIEQLTQIINSVQINKNNDDKYLLGGIKLGRNLKSDRYKPNPFIAIIGLKSEGWSDSKSVLNEQFSINGFLDMIMCFDGEVAVLGNKDKMPSIANPRRDIANDNLKLTFMKQLKDAKDIDIKEYYRSRIKETLKIEILNDEYPFSLKDRQKLCKHYGITCKHIKSTLNKNKLNDLTFSQFILCLENPFLNLDIYNIRIAMSVMAYWFFISCGREINPIKYLYAHLNI